MSAPKPATAERLDWFSDPKVKDREGKCGRCGADMVLSAFASAMAMTFNQALVARGERRLTAKEIARCEQCYSDERKDGVLYGCEPTAGQAKSLTDWRADGDGGQ